MRMNVERRVCMCAAEKHCAFYFHALDVVFFIAFAFAITLRFIHQTQNHLNSPLRFMQKALNFSKSHDIRNKCYSQRFFACKYTQRGPATSFDIRRASFCCANLRLLMIHCRTHDYWCATCIFNIAQK